MEPAVRRGAHPAARDGRCPVTNWTEEREVGTLDISSRTVLEVSTARHGDKWWVRFRTRRWEASGDGTVGWVEGKQYLNVPVTKARDLWALLPDALHPAGMPEEAYVPDVLTSSPLMEEIQREEQGWNDAIDVEHRGDDLASGSQLARRGGRARGHR